MPTADRTDEEALVLRRGVAGLFDAALLDWDQEDIEAAAERIKRGPNVVEISEDGTLRASVGGETVFTSTEYEALAIGSQLKPGNAGSLFVKTRSQCQFF